MPPEPQPSTVPTRRIGAVRRLSRIVTVLSRHGFADVVLRFRAPRQVRWTARILRVTGAASNGKSERLGERMRAAAVELGPAFVKLGQVLSMRPDLIPADIAFELRSLQDATPPVPFAEVRRIIAQEGLDAAFAEMVEELDEEPLAAASLAQVHRGILKDGRHVAVKVQRPGVRELFLADIELLRKLALRLERDPAVRDTFAPHAIVHELEKTVDRELDFTIEARATERAGRNFQGDEAVRIPAVIAELTTSRVLTMEYLNGIKVSDRDAMLRQGVDLPAIARRIVDAVLRQILFHGFFHGDPHPGNLFVLPGGVVGFVDFGITGRVTPRLREQLVDFGSAIVRHDSEALVSVATAAGSVHPATDRAALRADADDFLDRYAGVPSSAIKLDEAIPLFFDIVRRHKVRLPPELTLLGKALMTADSVARELDPRFDAVTVAAPLVRELMERRLTPRELASEAATTLREAGALASRLPRDASRILDLVKRNQLAVGFRHEGLEDFTQELDRSANRIAVALIVSALIVGSSIVVHAGAGPSVFDLPVLGVVGYLVAGIMGVSLVISILRTGRM